MKDTNYLISCGFLFLGGMLILTLYGGSWFAALGLLMALVFGAPLVKVWYDRFTAPKEKKDTAADAEEKESTTDEEKRHD